MDVRALRRHRNERGPRGQARLGSSRSGEIRSVVDVEGQCGDHDARRVRLERRLEEAPALVVQDLVAALAGDDLGDQDGDPWSIRRYRVDVLEHGAYQTALRVD